MSDSYSGHATRALGVAIGEQTQDDSIAEVLGEQQGPGVAVVYSAGRPCFTVYPLHGGRLRVGRAPGGVVLEDLRVSREHVEVSFTGQRWIVRDLNSRNGTYVNGTRVTRCDLSAESSGAEDSRVVRVGHSYLVLYDEILSVADRTVTQEDGLVIGPQLSSTIGEGTAAMVAGVPVYLCGPDGSERQQIAQYLHARGARRGKPFVSLNCASLPGDLAESLLFGQAAHGSLVATTGCVQGADSGTLFLDNVACLESLVQAKLLQVIERGEVTPVGGSRAQSVDILVCCGGVEDLRTSVVDKRFLTDLYYRVARVTLVISPLQSRPEEIPYWVAQELSAVDSRLVAHPQLIEECLRRPWPCNVRELRAAIAHAGRRARWERTLTVPPRLLNAYAGRAASDVAKRGASVKPRRNATPPREDIVFVLERENWNVAATARVLGVYRTQLCRWMDSFGIERPKARKRRLRGELPQ